MKKNVYLIFLMVFLLIGCSMKKTEEQGKEEAVKEDIEAALPTNKAEIIADRLDVPWSINKMSNTFYLSERSGNIVKIEDGNKVRQKVELKKKLSQAAEAGLLGFVLAPDFGQTSEAFVYYTYENSSGQFNRIVKLKLDGTVWTEQKILIDKIPSGQYHHGGRIKIGPDGKLYATTGDAATKPEIAQDLKSLGGKILRMNLDGSIPSDNPFQDSYVYSYGHRNPQGIAWQKDGQLYESEHGQSAHDEINHIKPGQNYGWPIIQGDEKREGMQVPLFHSGSDMTWAPSGMASYDGKLYVATLRGNAVREFDLKTGKTREVIKGLGRIRDILIEGDTLYFVSNNTDGRGTPDEADDKLYKISLGDI